MPCPFLHARSLTHSHTHTSVQLSTLPLFSAVLLDVDIRTRAIDIRTHLDHRAGDHPLGDPLVGALLGVQRIHLGARLRLVEDVRADAEEGDAGKSADGDDDDDANADAAGG